ncbi:uncharacterized protein LOC120249607 [Dioscorea cayenensis subsp. rotundata]|uniref:Uncharacterized protein LOC120249607 n=1 Tax=Dioscorea cayennensis subsp. rotundata TaxID=55577 RepID=A0AB40AH21_DIOCR|nr:uncharacterized protein LOC120249607 [Dioscorea cayenensis subsp. rotundata]
MPLLLFLFLCLSSLPFLSLAAVPAIIVFGDSTVDTGNNNAIPTLLKSNFMPYGRDFLGKPYPTGRFSNGRLASDFYAEAFGLGPIVPAYLDPAYTMNDFASAVCFASAGTGLDNATSDVLVSSPILHAHQVFVLLLQWVLFVLMRLLTARHAACHSCACRVADCCLRHEVMLSMWVRAKQGSLSLGKQHDHKSNSEGPLGKLHADCVKRRTFRLRIGESHGDDGIRFLATNFQPYNTHEAASEPESL